MNFRLGLAAAALLALASNAQAADKLRVGKPANTWTFIPVDVGRDSSSSFICLTSASAAVISSCSVPATSFRR